MEREYGPEGQIIIRGFPESEHGSYEPPEPDFRERVQDFFAYHWPAIFVVVAVIAAVGGGALAWKSFSEDAARLSDEEVAALARDAELRRNGGVFARGGTRPSGDLSVGPSDEYVPIQILSDPSGASVSIDFKPVGTTPIHDFRLPSGVYVFSLTMTDGARIDSVVILDDTSERSFLFSTPPPSEAIAQRGRGDVEAGNPDLGSAEVARRDETTTQRGDAGVQRDEPAERESEPVSRPAPEPAVGSERLAPGALIITSTPAGASVEIDGEHRGATPLHARGISPGEHELRIRMDGYTEAHEALLVEPAQTVMRSYELDALYGTVLVQARPWGSIYVDGELRARDLDVRQAIRLSIGSHRIGAVHPVLGRREVTVEVVAGQTREITIDLSAVPEER